ncbi:MAG: T9SS type A sorting domain-containing protein [Ignavibacteria bacterium]|nr:T9SS type A sorting domain-containing protein [Ignavibacteria bacterium]
MIPINPVTTIRFNLPETNSVILSIYNSLGEKVEDLIKEVKEAGTHTINFNVEYLPSEIYFYRLEANDFTKIKKMILVK